MTRRLLAPWGVALAGLAQLTFGLDDLLKGNVDLGMLLNVTSGFALLAAAWGLRRALQAAPSRVLVAAFGLVALLRLADLSTSLGDPLDAQLAAFFLIVAGALVNAGAAIAWARRGDLAIRVFKVGAALTGLGAVGYVLVAASTGHETILWMLGASIAALGWGIVFARVAREATSASDASASSP